MNNLHGQIMNLPCPMLGNVSDREELAHKHGHKQARHAAAELALEADAVRDVLLEMLSVAVEILRKVDPHPGQEDILSGCIEVSEAAIARATKP